MEVAHITVAHTAPYFLSAKIPEKIVPPSSLEYYHQGKSTVAHIVGPLLHINTPPRWKSRASATNARLVTLLGPL